MYTLSRLLLIVGLAACAYCLVILAVLTWPGSAIVIGIFLFARATVKRRGRLTTLGSARWADEDDLRQAGMLDADSGLILGRLPPSLAANRSGVRAVLTWGMSAREACQRFLYGSKYGRNQLVRLTNAVHVAAFGPSGAGKGVSLILIFLFVLSTSMVAVDFKGEIAQRTARYRQKMFRHRIVLLDPYRVVTQTPDCFNGLDFIDRNSPTAIDECAEMAKALVSRSADEKEPHWNDSAELIITAVLATIVWYGGPETRSLQTAREILSDPQKLDTAIKLMCESDCWGGMLARMGRQLTYFADKEKNSVLTTVGRHLRFLDSLAVAESTSQSSFNPADLRKGRMSVYLILPPDRMSSQSALLRVWTSSLLRAVVKGGLAV
jgi:type IV secretion system protein VirD4